MKKIIFLSFLITVILSGCSTLSSKDILSPEEAMAKAEEFIQANLVEEGTEVSIKKVEESGNDLYKLTVDVSGQEVESYVSKDGVNFFPQVINIPEVEAEIQASQTATTNTTQTTEAYSAEDLEKIATFIDCAAGKGLKIYGANWCGWTKKLVVDTLGGFDMAASVYVECTEEVETCTSEGVTGYPTIKINGELYEGARTFEALSAATGCAAPDINTVVSSTGDATCN